MKTTTYENEIEWLGGRIGKITGTRASDVISTAGPTKEMMCDLLTERGIEFKKSGKKEELEALLTGEMKDELFGKLPKKKGFYELIAERIGLPPEEGEKPMDRGHALEKEAIAHFEEQYEKKVNTSLVIWSRDEEDSIAVSPDGFMEKKGVVDEAVEVKCLGSANHIKAWHTQAIPDDYWFQVLQYFIVNDDLKKLYFVLYDPRIPAIELVVLEVTRDQVQAEVSQYLAYQKRELAEVREIVNKITF